MPQRKSKGTNVSVSLPLDIKITFKPCLNGKELKQRQAQRPFVNRELKYDVIKKQYEKDWMELEAE